MKRDELRRLNRDELLARAEALGVARPAVLTQSELIDEIVKRVSPSASGVRGWLGRARDLVAQVVSKGLHLPEAARLFRGESPEPLPPPPPPLPTVTLAEIYVAQGHVAKGLAVLEQVLEREPSHAAAQELAEAWRKRLGRSAQSAATATVTTANADLGGPLTEVVAERVAEPSAEAVAEPIAEALVEPSAEVVAEPVAETAAEPIAEVAAEPIAEVGAELVEEVAAEPIAEAAVEPVATPIVEVLRPTIERDRVEVAPLEGGCVSIAWELRPVRYARALADSPEGEFVVRVFSARVESSAVATSTIDVSVDGLRGAVTVPGLTGRAEICACLARKAGATFVPLAVASRVTLRA